MFDRFNNLNLGHKINLGFATLVLVLLLVVELIFVAGRQATEKINLTVDVRVPTTLAADDAQANLLKMQAAVRGYLAVGDLKNIDDYNQAKTRFQENLAELKTLSAEWSVAEDIERLDRLIENFALWVPLPEELFELHNNPLQNQPALQLETRKIRPLNTQLPADVNRLIALLQQLEAETEVRPIPENLIDFRTSFESMRTNLSAYAATGDLTFKFRYSEALVSNSTFFGAITAEGVPTTRLSDDEDVAALLERIVASRKDYLTYAGEIFDAVEGEQSHLDLYLFQNELEPETEQMILLLEDLASGQQSLLQAELEQGKQSLTALRYQTLLGGLLVLLLGMAIVYIFRRNIAKPIQRLRNTAERIGAGDLAARATVETDDEIGDLAGSFNHMAGELSKTIHALEEAKESAETANRTKSRFLAGMSHELRTPLNAILGYVQILSRTDKLSAAQKNAHSVIESNGQHLLGLINDILDLSKIEASKLELLPAPIMLHDFLADIVSMIQSRTQDNDHVQFIVQIDDRLPAQIVADETRLRQILFNLLENALKFTAHGTVTLCVDAVRTTVDTVHLQIKVVDTGIGISAAEIEKIFRPFEQIGDSPQRAKGTGLGLAIVQELVYSMDGELGVESEPGVGSSFCFEATFPAVWEDESLCGEGAAHVLNDQNGDVPIVSHPTPSQSPIGTPLLAPPPQELSMLLDMALKGELPRLERVIEDLAAEEVRYQPFTDQIKLLIRAYEEEEIVRVLQLYLLVEFGTRSAK